MQKGLVSVIIPTYNRADLIIRAIDSVKMQKYRPIEVIIIDDHGQDNTREMLDGYNFLDIGFKYYYNSINVGPGATRNVGLRAADGEYIAFLDSDDEWIMDEKISLQVDFLKENNDYGFVATNWGVKNPGLENGKTNHTFQTDKEFREIALFYYVAHTSSWLIRKEIIDKAGYFWTGKAEDSEYLLKIGTLTKCHCLPIVSEKYHNMKTGDFQKNMIKSWFFGLLICTKYRHHYPYFFKAFLHRFFRGIWKGLKMIARKTF